MIRILLVEDDASLSFILQSSLEQIIGGYQVTVAANGKEGLELLRGGGYDVIVSDVEMPVMDGIEMTQHIRSLYPQLAIILITGRTAARDVVSGYHSGADLYIKKPFLPEELDAHIQALMKRKLPEPDEAAAGGETTYAIGKYLFTPSQNRLSDGEEACRLTRRESAVLEMLCRQMGQLVSREEILIKIWGIADFYASRSLDVFITKLRKRLSGDASVGLQTVKGVGISLLVS